MKKALAAGNLDLSKKFESTREKFVNVIAKVSRKLVIVEPDIDLYKITGEQHQTAGS